MSADRLARGKHHSGVVAGDIKRSNVELKMTSGQHGSKTTACKLDDMLSYS